MEVPAWAEHQPRRHSWFWATKIKGLGPLRPKPFVVGASMANIVQLGSFAQKRTMAQQVEKDSQLRQTLEAVARGRHPEQSVFWLKENVEFLQVLASQYDLAHLDGLSVYQEFYESSVQILSDFPQYYRFIVGITKLLEPYFATGQYPRLLDFVSKCGLWVTEVNDIQRAEALYLRGASDDAVSSRLREFTANPTFFAVPNKAACYYLTHIVFYETAYGQRPALHKTAYAQALYHAGCFAFFDANLDLLSEVCVSLQYLEADIPKPWQDLIREARFEYQTTEQTVAALDDYHTYLMIKWARTCLGVGESTLDLTMRTPCVAVRQDLATQIPVLWSTVQDMESDAPLDAQRLVQTLRRLGYVVPARMVDMGRDHIPQFEEFLRAFARLRERN